MSKITLSKGVAICALLVTYFLTCSCFSSKAQIDLHYDPTLQPTGNLQYFSPVGREGEPKNLFVGDCIPFFDKGTYYLYWLIDSSHHTALHGLGGHQWVLSTTRDLKTWKHYPVVIGLDETWEKSICTGSVVKKGNNFYAFYATRVLKDGEKNEQLSYAISQDGIHFKKQWPNPFYTAPSGYDEHDFRDPKATIDKRGRFHLFIAGRQTQTILQDENGCLVHLESGDGKKWTVLPTLLSGEKDTPECPDYFYWKNWYYLLYSVGSNTYYVKSRKPYGPWLYPRSQALNEDWSNVVKTAAFTGGRRIAAGWIPSRQGNVDEGGERFGGNMVFRELSQEPDGDLSEAFPPEMIPPTGQALNLPIMEDKVSGTIIPGGVRLQSAGGIGAAHIETVPPDARIKLEIVPSGNYEETGLYLRSTEKAKGGYKLSFSADRREVCLGNTCIVGVEGLNRAFTLDILMKDDILDVCVNGKRCIVNRQPEQKGDFLWFYIKNGSALFRSVTLRKITK